MCKKTSTFWYHCVLYGLYSTLGVNVLMFKQHTPDPNDTLWLPTRAGNTVCILYCAYFTAFIVLCILYKGHRLKHVNGDERDPYTQTPQTHPSMIPMMMLLEDVPKTNQTHPSVIPRMITILNDIIGQHFVYFLNQLMLFFFFWRKEGHREPFYKIHPWKEW